MADKSDSNNPHQEESSDGGGYRPLKHMDESLFPNNDGDFASSFMHPHGPTSQLDIRRPAANPPPWEDPSQAWRYVDGRVWTGEAFVVSRRTQPDTRAEAANPRASDISSVAVPPQDPGQTQASRGLHGPDVFGFTGGKRAPADLQEREPGSKTPSNALVVFPLTHHVTDSPSPVPDGRDSASRGSPTPPRRAAQGSSIANRGPFVFTGWNDDAKRELFLWKVKRKKGYAFFLHLFPGETAESLHAAFKEHREDGERLYNG